MAKNADHGWSDKKALLDRAKKVEGQSTAVRRMLDDDRSCADVLQQVAALNSAAQRLAVLLLEDHIQVRLEQGASAAEVAEEARKLIGRVLKI